jgi:putative ABC transport system substrate-binding protein
MAAVSDPVGARLVESLAHPGTNVTGLSQLATELVGKRLELLRELFPNLVRLAVLASGTSPADTQLRLDKIRSVAQPMGIQLLVLNQKGTSDWPDAFDAMRRERVQAVYVQTGPGTIDNKKLLVTLLMRQRLPAIFEVGELADAGGLISYGYDVIDMYRRSAVFLDRIFKGARPADLPVEQPTKFELVVNKKTAKALGVAIPQTVLLRADRVIE